MFDSLVEAPPESPSWVPDWVPEWVEAGEVPEWERPPAPTLPERVRALRDALRRLVEAAPAEAAATVTSELVDALVVADEVGNLLAPVDQALIAELERRGAPEVHGYPTTAALLTGLLRVRPAVATARTAAVRACAPRTTLQGDPLPPERPHVAAAQAEGVISPDHAAVVDRGLRALPVGVDPAVVDDVERALVDLARRTDPGQVAKAARYARERFDPDGAEPRDGELDRRRTLVLRQRDDGTGEIAGVLTPECLAAVQAVLSPLAAPRPTDAAGPDPRRPGQRLHDSLEEAMHRLLRSGTLPDSGGVPTSISVTMTLDQLRTGCGLAATEHDGTIPVARLLRMAAECEYLPVVLDAAGGVVSYGVERRCAPPAMAKALRARDGGCTFPGCRRPAGWTERHHVVEHHRGGSTSLDNLVLLCGYHHRSFATHGWHVVMRDGRPWWIPPPDVDPERRPIRNTHWDTPARC